MPRVVYTMLSGFVPQDSYKRSLPAFRETVLRWGNFRSAWLYILRPAQARLHHPVRIS